MVKEVLLFVVELDVFWMTYGDIRMYLVKNLV